MTGERLYREFTKAAASFPKSSYRADLDRTPDSDSPPPAWHFLSARDRKVFNEAARKLRVVR